MEDKVFASSEKDEAEKESAARTRKRPQATLCTMPTEAEQSELPSDQDQENEPGHAQADDQLERLLERMRKTSLAARAAQSIESDARQWNSQYGDLAPELVLRLPQYASVRLTIKTEGIGQTVLDRHNTRRTNPITLYRTNLAGAEHYYRETPDDTPGDGDCFYHAFLHAFLRRAPSAAEIRELRGKIAEHIRENSEEVGAYLVDAQNRDHAQKEQARSSAHRTDPDIVFENVARDFGPQAIRFMLTRISTITLQACKGPSSRRQRPGY